MIDGMRAPLNWASIVDGVEGLLGVRYTRQSLAAHERIVRAVKIRNSQIRGEKETAVLQPVELRVAMEQIARLRAKIVRLEAENNALIAQFARWGYNASLHGMTKEDLDRSMPMTDRDRTRLRFFKTGK
jgi:hypothetical protein